jgi:hypothetical protein
VKNRATAGFSEANQFPAPDETMPWAPLAMKLLPSFEMTRPTLLTFKVPPSLLIRLPH